MLLGLGLPDEKLSDLRYIEGVEWRLGAEFQKFLTLMLIR